jgi:transposase
MVAATRGKGVLAAFYQRLIKAGKPPKLAIIACMRKLPVRLNTMLARGQDWSEQPA